VKKPVVEEESREVQRDTHPFLSNGERERYLRQLLIFGDSGQLSLRNAHIFIAGCGGLGSPIAMYLASAGIGRLTIVDHDTVSLSNLNRQLLHLSSDIGKEKTVSALEKLADINPNTSVSACTASINQVTIDSLAEGADIIIDAVDSMETRHVLNAYAVRNGKPYIYGSVCGFSGQMMVIIPGKTACLRCIIDLPPGDGIIPVLGVTPGIVGLMQANEAIKMITGTGKVRSGEFITWDGESGTLERFAVRKNPRCPVCGSRDLPSRKNVVL
jgi:adenylyltransferase/sulfurtransferase